MGRYSFSSPGSRFGLKPWFRIGNLDVTTSVLGAALVTISLFVWSISSSTTVRLALLPDEVLGGEVWRVITWPLANAEPTLWSVLGIAIFWYFGSEIEGRMGRNRFAFLILSVILVPGVIATALDVVQHGFRPVQFAVFLLFIMEYPFARFFFGIPGWVLGAVFLGLEVLQITADDDLEGMILLAASLGTAAIIARSYGMLGNLPWVPAIPLPKFDGRSHHPRPKRAKRPKKSGPRVVEGPWDAGGRSGPMPTPPPANNTTAADQEELDNLLDKINDSGIDGLTTAEKQRLNELSKRLRDG